MSSEVASFAALAALLTLAPGQDTLLTLRNSATSGVRSGAETAFGICCGLFAHATLSAVGLSALLISSAWAFGVLKLAGSLYLAWLAIESFLRARDSFRSRNEQSRPLERAVVLSSWKAFRQGFLSNALNPKTATFYLAILPQFVRIPESALADSLFLAAVHFLIAFVWLCLLSTMISFGRNVLSRPLVSTTLHGLAGLGLAGFAGMLTFGPEGEP